MVELCASSPTYRGAVDEICFVGGMLRFLVTANVVPSSSIVTLMMEAIRSSETQFLHNVFRSEGGR
jgi:hypothetical protein